MPATAEIVEALGGAEPSGRRVDSPEDLKEWIREGLPFASLERVVERFGLNREEISSALDLTPRTLARRKQERRLRRDESDRLFRLVRIATQASEVLGDAGRPGAGCTHPTGLWVAGRLWSCSIPTSGAIRSRKCSAASSTASIADVPAHGGTHGLAPDLGALRR